MITDTDRAAARRILTDITLTEVGDSLYVTRLARMLAEARDDGWTAGYQQGRAGSEPIEAAT